MFYRNQQTHFSMRHSRYNFEKCLHFSDWWPEVFRQLRYSFFAWAFNKPTSVRNFTVNQYGKPTLAYTTLRNLKKTNLFNNGIKPLPGHTNAYDPKGRHLSLEELGWLPYYHQRHPLQNRATFLRKLRHTYLSMSCSCLTAELSCLFI